ncbi:unnamed protein product [Paramecium pentaurelia]|uniref:Uncharacterized protein n=1 Tax=Paramecium pentaurelia TaxID=43138 RepID=A0A8S1XDB6_9CILI|nr:unnamed protein product [Paramecium pentaurelia]
MFGVEIHKVLGLQNQNLYRIGTIYNQQQSKAWQELRDLEDMDQDYTDKSLEQNLILLKSLHSNFKLYTQVVNRQIKKRRFERSIRRMRLDFCQSFNFYNYPFKNYQTQPSKNLVRDQLIEYLIPVSFAIFLK